MLREQLRVETDLSISDHCVRTQNVHAMSVAHLFKHIVFFNISPRTDSSDGKRDRIWQKVLPWQGPLAASLSPRSEIQDMQNRRCCEACNDHSYPGHIQSLYMAMNP